MNVGLAVDECIMIPMKSHRFSLVALFLAISQFNASAQGNSVQEQAELDGYAHFLSMTSTELKEFVSKAESGDAEAQYWVAVDSESGLRLKMDSQKATQWLLKSAEGGFAPAQRKYGLMFAHSNPPVGKQWLLAAAEQGDAEAQMWLGAADEEGWFDAIDAQGALKWYRMAAEAGQVDAQMLLGNRYELGHGVEQDYAVAADWYRKAAEHVLPLSTGTSEARYRLALLYIEGHGVPQDYVQAYFWLRLVGPEENVNKAKAHMTAVQIDEGEQLVKEWKERHRLKPEIARAYDIKEEP
jgi:TPR repeat protein